MVMPAMSRLRAARLFWESALAFFRPQEVVVPVVARAVPEELDRARRISDRRYPRLVYSSGLEESGHLALRRELELLDADLRTARRSILTPIR
jgi:hypothetical protein